MKEKILGLLLLISAATSAQKAENVIIITTDGFRWQELFGGMDKEIADNKRFHEGDSAAIFSRYWAADPGERRKKLLPFFWNTIAQHGRIYGNREYGNEVNVSNPYWFSYPGYSEIMCGYADTAINSNDYKPNPNTTLPEFLNRQPAYKHKVAAFTAWEAFNRILNEQRSGIPVVAAYDHSGGANPTANEKLINAMLDDSYKKWGGECFDVFTHYAAMEYLQTKKPKLLYISYGETDEWAHAGAYRSYLDAAHQFDAWIKQIWDFVQSDPQYRNKTTLFITTDHGRGDVQKEKWTSHGASVEGANQIWFAVMGPNTPAGGEIKEKGLYYQKQFAQTIAKLLGTTYKASHPVAEAIGELVR
ncbi:alkaline phosphatase family protein [Sediminibacterium soli]|uniref:alkaline phosphatase family protein n=1 Tax=Sediminibacterium soli TaxID=2698829 RepID=UPI00137950B7|nr:alkaline phosphatase family protein [Sediminibacterium soli]NCI45591.1 LTA synthase family protein [Sediminibacterium soli]